MITSSRVLLLPKFQKNKPFIILAVLHRGV